MRELSPYALGATMYTPATRTDVLKTVYGEKHPELRSLVICLEDAVAQIDVEMALHNLHNLLEQIDQRGGRGLIGPMLFVRPRDTHMAAVLNDWPLMKHVDGFVLPKLHMGNLSKWESAVTNPNLYLMPTLETPDVYNPGAMAELGQALRAGFNERIIALRIGGNDLLGCLGLRRNAATTLYSTPMSYVIPMLAGVMGAQGFSLTAPVFELLDSPALLEEELALDLAHGLVGKTAIHPCQIRTINDALRVSLDDFNSAQLIVDEVAPAVFRHNDAMCEPATHLAWAKRTLERARFQGIKQPDIASGEMPLRLAEAAQ